MTFHPDKIVWVGNDSQTCFQSEKICKDAGNWTCWKCYDDSDEDGEDEVTDVHDLVADIIHVASIILGVFGIFCNFLSIYVLSKPSFGSRFSHLLIVLSYIDISYLMLCIFEAFIKQVDEAYPGRNLLNFYLVLYPFLFHPGKQILQTSMIILTVIFSLDRYIAIFHPYKIYSVNSVLATILRGPKRKHIILYLICVLFPSIVYCIPHFLEYTAHRQDIIKKLGYFYVTA